MKSLKTILPISAGVVGIVAFWLVPNINKAKTVSYKEAGTKTTPKTKVVIAPVATNKPTKTIETKTVKKESKALPTVPSKKIQGTKRWNEAQKD